MSTRRDEILRELDRLISEYFAEGPWPDRSDTSVRLSAVSYDDREIRAAVRALLSGWISQGPRVREFEEAFARYIGVAHGVGVNSGSSANLVALSALVEAGRLAPGDEVIMPATTFATVASPVIQVGGVPVYVDVDTRTYNIDPDAAEEALSPRTRVLMVVHTVGYPADMERLVSLAERHGVVLLEDCCEAHGAAIHGRRVGSFGHLATSSFFVAHNMTTGEGGMVLTNDARYAELCRSLREFGRFPFGGDLTDRFFDDGVLRGYDKRYVFERLGYNVRMTDVTAALGSEQLRKLDAMNEQRIRNAAYYRERLARFADVLALPVVADGYRHTYYTFPIFVRPESGYSRNDLVLHLERNGIETRPLFAGCLPDQPGFRAAPHRTAGELRNARLIRDHAFFVGVHPMLEESDLRRVVAAIGDFIERGAQPRTFSRLQGAPSA